MTDIKEREAFEAAWSQAYPLHGKSPFTRSLINPQGYAGTRINDGWKMWQARAALAASQEKAEPVASSGAWSVKPVSFGDIAHILDSAGNHVATVYTNEAKKIAAAHNAAPVAAQASEPANPSGYAYRYPDAFGGGTVIRFNGGEEVNGSRPIEAIPYWFNAPKPSAEAAIRTLKGLGYTYHGGQQWKPPLGDSRVTVDRLNRLEAARDAALEEAANTATGFLVGDPLAGIPLRNPMTHEIADAIRALKSAPPQPAEQPSASPSELFESGYALTDEEIAKLAESMPGGLEGFLKGWGWQNFARAVESEVMLAIASAQGEQE